MSNKIKLVAIAILITVITAGSLFISGVFKPKKGDQLVLNSSSVQSSFVSSSSQIASITSSSSVISSSVNTMISSTPTVQSSSKVVEAVSSAESVKTSSECNLPESPNVIKTDVGCFELNVVDRNINFEGKDSQILNKSKSLYKLIATDYYKKIYNKFISKKHAISIDYLKFIDNSTTQADVSMWDLDYFKNKPAGDALYLNLATYQLDLTSNRYT